LHLFSTLSELYRTLADLGHNEGAGDPEDADTHGDDHLPDGLRYLLINLGGGAEAWIAWAKRQAEAAAAEREGTRPPALPAASLPVPDSTTVEPEPVPDLIPADPMAVLREARNAASRQAQGAWQ